MVEFGKGPTLRDAAVWLGDDLQRRLTIIDVAERNNVIEGLPPFSEETRRRLLAQLQSTASHPPAPPGPLPTSDRNLS